MSDVHVRLSGEKYAYTGVSSCSRNSPTQILIFIFYLNGVIGGKSGLVLDFDWSAVGTYRELQILVF